MGDLYGDSGVATNVGSNQEEIPGLRAKRDYPPPNNNYYLGIYKMEQMENKLKNLASKDDVKDTVKEQATEQMQLMDLLILLRSWIHESKS